MPRSWMAVEVSGASMLPTLRPGDWLLVCRAARIRTGDLVVARHPYERDLLLIKRAGHRAATGWWLESDNQRAPARQDSWDFDAVPDRLVLGRVVLRYWPPRRLALRFRPPSAFPRRRAR